MKIISLVSLILIAFFSFAGDELVDVPIATEHEEISQSPVASLVEQFFSRNVVSAKMSPDGRFICYEKMEGKVSQLILLNTENYEQILFLQDRENGSVSILDYNWIDNNTVVSDLFINGEGRALIASNFSIADGKLKNVENQNLAKNSFLINPLATLSDRFVVGRWRENGVSLYVYDITSKSIEGQFQSKFKLNIRSPEVAGWLTNSRGEVVMAYGVENEEETKKAWARNSRGRWKVIWEGEKETTFVPVLLLGEGKSALVISDENREFSGLYLYDFESRKYQKALYQSNEHGIHSVIKDHHRDRVKGVKFIANGYLNQYYFVQKGELNDSLLREFEGTLPYVTDEDISNKNAIVLTQSSTDPGSYYLFKDNKSLIKFATVSPSLNDFEFNPSKVITSTSEDGLEIESFLTLPYGQPATLPPLIVMPHGGPIAVRDTRHFNYSAQFLASLGYAVLQTNYRGSAGYGKTFKNAGKQQWGRKIEADIRSAVTAVLDAKLADKGKVCVFGISYGGYSALISSIQDSDLYQCAASHAGVTDIPLLFANSRVTGNEELKEALSDIVGDAQTDMDTLISYSPVYKSDSISMPVFISHGDQDRTVDIEHFYRLRKLLTYFKKPYTELILEGVGHNLGELQDTKQFYEMLDAFFREHLHLEPYVGRKSEEDAAAQ